ncbi:MAG: hypothetical protein Kow00128_18340 [Deltaproteobacteria bacterium]
MEETFRRLLATIPDYLYSAVMEGGTPRHEVVSPGVEKITGYSVEEHLADPWLWLSCTHPEDRPRVERRLSRVLSGEALWLEFRIVRKDGQVRWVRDYGVPTLDERGKVVRVDGIVSDVTERKEMEESNRLLLEQLHQAQKMQAVGTLAGGIAHEFNNMLGAIIGYTSLLKNMMKENHPFYGPVSTIERSAERAADLTRKLLGFARGGKYRAEPISLNDVVHRVLPIIERTFDRAIAIETRLAEALPPTEGDMGQLEHSLLNLCLNARDAMPKGGRLTIETAPATIGKEFVALHPWARTGEFVRLTVADTGCGMTPETRKRIFEPFFTTKKPGAGTGSGMGLAMVYGAVKNHGGFIEVHSAPDRGTTMNLFLPVSWRMREAAAPPEKGPVRGGKETILVVDDESALREVAEAVLSGAGYRVLAVGTGEEACELLSDRSREVALVLLDIEMPGMGGKQAFLTLRGLRPGMPVLVSTGHGVEGAASEILQLGGTGFLGKPFRANELLRAVRRALDSE